MVAALMVLPLGQNSSINLCRLLQVLEQSQRSCLDSSLMGSSPMAPTSTLFYSFNMLNHCTGFWLRKRWPSASYHSICNLLDCISHSALFLWTALHLSRSQNTWLLIQKEQSSYSTMRVSDVFALTAWWRMQGFYQPHDVLRDCGLHFQDNFSI